MNVFGVSCGGGSAIIGSMNNDGFGAIGRIVTSSLPDSAAATAAVAVCSTVARGCGAAC